MSVLDVATSAVAAEFSRETFEQLGEWRQEDKKFRDSQWAWLELCKEQVKEDEEFIDVRMRQLKLTGKRRQIDERVEQLKNVVSIATLIAGFSLVVLMELNFSVASIPKYLLALYAATSAFTVCLMTYAFVTSTLILVGILKKFELIKAAVKDKNAQPPLVQEDLQCPGMVEQPSFMIEEQKQNVVEPNFVQDRASDFEISNHIQDESSIDLQPDTSDDGNFRSFHDSDKKNGIVVFWEIKCQEDWNRSFMAFSLMVPCFLLNIIFAGFIKFLPLVSPPAIISVVCGITMILLFWQGFLKWGLYILKD